MGTDADDADRARGMVPPGKPGVHSGEAEDPADLGPTSPGHPEGSESVGPQSGGYDDRPPIPSPDNRKGGYGAG